MVVITYPDGKTDVFDLAAKFTDPVYKSGMEVQIGFVPRDGTTSSLKALDTGLLYYNLGQIVDHDQYEALDPSRYLLTTADGRKFTIHETTGLERLEDQNGNILVIDEHGISHSAGKSITFERDNENRISTIIDPMGNALTYTYDENGDLTAFTNQEGNTTTYTYDDQHNLLTLTKPPGRRRPDLQIRRLRPPDSHPRRPRQLDRHDPRPGSIHQRGHQPEGVHHHLYI